MIELTMGERIKVGLKKVLALCFYCLFPWRLFLLRHGLRTLFILAYHRILPDDKQSILPYISVNPKQFEKHLLFLKTIFRVISLDEAATLLEKPGDLNENCVVITFDDGYRDNYDYAFPVLLRQGVTASFFVTTGLIGTDKMLWPDMVRQIYYGSNDKKNSFLKTRQANHNRPPESVSLKIKEVKRTITGLKKLNEDEKRDWIQRVAKARGLDLGHSKGFKMMSWANLREMSDRGMIVGSHTVNHPMLRTLAEKELDTELRQSKAQVENSIGCHVKHFAYPNGTQEDLSPLILDSVKRAGYTSAVTTMRGSNCPGTDLFSLRRTGVYRSDGVPELVLKLCFEKIFCRSHDGR